MTGPNDKTADDWKQRLPSGPPQSVELDGQRQQRGGASSDEPFRGSWLDVLALIIATYQVLAVPFLILLAGIGLAAALFFLIFR